MLFYVAIAKSAQEPGIKDSEIAVAVFDAEGKEITSRSLMPKNSRLVEVGNAGSQTANAIYVLDLKSGQIPTSAKVTWLGKTHEFPQLSFWK